MRAEFPNGYVLEATRLPDRKKPLLLIQLDGEYMGHAMFKDDKSKEAFDRFMLDTWGERRPE